MKKTILNLGRALNNAEQKEIQGGGGSLAVNQCYSDSDCCNYPNNSSYGYVCQASKGKRGVCVPGIFEESPCGV